MTNLGFQSESGRFVRLDEYHPDVQRCFLEGHPYVEHLRLEKERAEAIVARLHHRISQLGGCRTTTDDPAGW